MRVDKYLKVSRLIKRRTIANEACDAGRVSINGKPVATNDATNRSLFVNGGACCPGQYGYGLLSCNPDGEPVYELSFTIQLMDIHEESVLYTDTQTITLRLDPAAKEGYYEKN